MVSVFKRFDSQLIESLIVCMHTESSAAGNLHYIRQVLNSKLIGQISRSTDLGARLLFEKEFHLDRNVAVLYHSILMTPTIAQARLVSHVLISAKKNISLP